MPKALDPLIVKVLEDYGENPRTACWDCHGTWVVLHKALERIAAKAKIKFEAPSVIQADAEKKVVALCVTGTMADRSEWSVGEAAPYNNKNAYPFAMAEKRAKDRVILKLVGLHGVAYSEDEADDFKTDPGKPVDEPPAEEFDKVKNPPGISKVKQEVWEATREINACCDGDALIAYLPTLKDLCIRCAHIYTSQWTGPEEFSGLKGTIEKFARDNGVEMAVRKWLAKVEEAQPAQAAE